MTEVEFTSVYLDTYRDLCLMALRHVHSVSVAEDIVQDAFCRVLVRRPDVFCFEDVSQTKAYMWTTVRNGAIDWCRRHSGRSDSLEDRMVDCELSALVDQLFSPESYGAYDYEILSDSIKEAMSGLPPRAREVFKLRREEGLSNKDVAQKLGVTVKAVEKQMTYSLKSIRSVLKLKGIPFITLLFFFFNQVG